VAEGPLQFLAVTLDWDDFVGRLVIGRLFRGELRRGQVVAVLRGDDSEAIESKVTQLYRARGIERVPVEQRAGWRHRGDRRHRGGRHRRHARRPRSIREALPPHHRRRAHHLDALLASTTRRHRRARRSLRHLAQDPRAPDPRSAHNVAIRVRGYRRTPDAFEVAGRGELQLAILIETMRRESFELGLGKPAGADQATSTGSSASRWSCW
jgi:GTP-binding protein